MLNPRLGTLVAMIVMAAATRLLPHPPNLTAMTALALFGGAFFADKRLALVLPLAVLALTDLALGVMWSWSSMAVGPHMEVQYIAFAMIVALGFTLRRNHGVVRTGVTAVVASMLFFVVSNLGTWAFEGLYPKTFAGLVECYVAAIPFWRNTLLGDLLYTALLFGGFHLLERNFTALRVEPKAA
jgi:hypothetical protein